MPEVPEIGERAALMAMYGIRIRVLFADATIDWHTYYARE